MAVKIETRVSFLMTKNYLLYAMSLLMVEIASLHKSGS